MKRKLFILATLLLAAAIGVLAESTDCKNPNYITADGRPDTSDFPGNTSYYWAFKGQVGHSYSVEVLSQSDNDYASNGFIVFGWAFNVGDDFCGTNSTLAYEYTGEMAPDLSKPGIRYGFIASKDGIYGLRLDSSVNAAGFSLRVVDTTLFNPRWSTWSGFASTWGLNNNSDHDLSGTLTVYDISGSVVKTASVTIPAGKVKFYSSAPSDLNLPKNVAGSVMFAFVGPPGGIQADAYMLNSNASVVVPTKFETRNVH